MLMTFIYFAVVVLVFIMIYNYFTSSSSRVVERVERKDMVEGSRNASQYKFYSGDNLPISKLSNSYTISFWVYINDYKYSLKENKYILMKGNKDENNDSPIIYLTPYQNNLVVRVKLQSQEDPTQFETDESRIDEFKVETSINENQTLKEDSAVSELNNNNNNPIASEPLVENTPQSTINNKTNDQFMNLPVKDNFQSIEAFGNISNNSAPEASVSYNNDFFTEINGENLKEVRENFGPGAPPIENSQSDNTANNNTVNDNNANANEMSSSNKEDKYDECMIQDIPLQKWVHVAVGIYNNILDIYQDGKLKSSCVLRGFPEPPTGEIHLTPFGGFSGKIASVSGFNKSISQDMAYQIYREGPNKTGLYSFFSNLITFK